ncbi:MAG: adenine phosphoribosyltransferase [Planctomycetota bacterium]|nr:adenine phosphoribosyltransferase [Planctomycetota bacterium]
MIDLSDFIRDIADFPTEGIIFKDITPLLLDPVALDEAIGRLAEPYRNADIEVVAGVESRGFIFGPAVARELGAGFIPIRKPGKLPHKTVSREYALEYGTDAIEMHADAIADGTRVLMLDDLLATGGTMAAACEMVKDLGGNIIGIAFLIELCFLNGRDKLPGYEIHSLIRVEK